MECVRVAAELSLDKLPELRERAQAHESPTHRVQRGPRTRGCLREQVFRCGKACGLLECFCANPVAFPFGRPAAHAGSGAARAEELGLSLVSMLQGHLSLSKYLVEKGCALGKELRMPQIPRIRLPEPRASAAHRSVCRPRFALCWQSLGSQKAAAHTFFRGEGVTCGVDVLRGFAE